MSVDIADIGAEMDALDAARRGDFGPLTGLFLAGKPLGDNAKKIIAGRMMGTFKVKRGTKPKNETVTANKDIYLEFWSLQQSGKYPSDKAIYAEIAQRDARQVGGVEKAVKAGRKAMSKVMRRNILKDTEAAYQETYLEFLHLKQTEKYPSDKAVYAEIAQRDARQVAVVEKAVKKGQKATSEAIQRYTVKNGAAPIYRGTYLVFLHLQQTGKYPSYTAVYAEIARRYGQQIDMVEKAVKAGRQATSEAVRHYILDDTRAS